MMLPKHQKNKKRPKFKKRFQGHRTWVRQHGCLIEHHTGGADPCDGESQCAHVDYAGFKGTGEKVPDWFTVSLCRKHHAESHRGIITFEKKYGISLVDYSEEFARRSPKRREMEEARKEYENFYSMKVRD